jgi:hypothetical protein
MNIQTQHLTLSAMFIALGILFPILFHAIGLGSIFLPMFWPVAASSFFLSVPYPIFVGIITPILSALFTGMPPVSPPIAYVMMFELAFLTGVTNFLYQRTKWGMFWVLLSGLAFAPILGLPPKIVSTASIIKGMPGVVFMSVLLPFIIRKIKDESIFGLRKLNV